MWTTLCVATGERTVQTKSGDWGDLNILLMGEVAGVTGKAVEQHRPHRGKVADDWTAKRDMWMKMCLDNDTEVCTTFDFNQTTHLDDESDQETPAAG